jgi:D-alanyl-D-alanine-carboxypeptidase/D-alanyl-D-alanine-endopeptidase
MTLGGMLGLWLTGLTLGVADRVPAEWCDGNAPELEALIRTRCLPFVQRGNSVGMTVALVNPTGATVMAFGRPSLTSRTVVNGETLFEIGSITKTFTAIALARAIERGEVRLDQPIQELLPEGVRLPLAAQAVTLRHLTHTSGFPRLPAATNGFAPGSGKMLLFGSDPYHGFTEEDLLANLQSVTLRSDPGTKAAYSNLGLITLGYLLASNGGVSYEALIEREVCRPLRLQNTVVDLTGPQVAAFSQGYRAVLRGGPFLFALRSSPWGGSSLLGGAGALRSNGPDMLKYLQANMRPAGSPIENALRTAQQELFRESKSTAYGMNWVRSRGESSTQDVIWHNGGTGGFSSFLGFTEDGQNGVVVLSNSAQSVDDLGIDLLRSLKRPAPKQ